MILVLALMDAAPKLPSFLKVIVLFAFQLNALRIFIRESSSSSSLYYEYHVNILFSTIDSRSQSLSSLLTTCIFTSRSMILQIVNIIKNKDYCTLLSGEVFIEMYGERHKTASSSSSSSSSLPTLVNYYYSPISYYRLYTHSISSDGLLSESLTVAHAIIMFAHANVFTHRPCRAHLTRHFYLFCFIFDIFSFFLPLATSIA